MDVKPINSSFSSHRWPGARTGATRWYDIVNGKLWMFGGVGFMGRPTRRAGVLGIISLMKNMV